MALLSKSKQARPSKGRPLGRNGRTRLAALAVVAIFGTIGCDTLYVGVSQVGWHHALPLAYTVCNLYVHQWMHCQLTEPQLSRQSSFSSKAHQPSYHCSSGGNTHPVCNTHAASCGDMCSPSYSTASILVVAYAWALRRILHSLSLVYRVCHKRKVQLHWCWLSCSCMALLVNTAQCRTTSIMLTCSMLRSLPTVLASHKTPAYNNVGVCVL